MRQPDPTDLAAHNGALRALARQLTREDPEDHVQDAYVAALSGTDQPRSAGAWLRQVVRNGVRGKARRRARWRELERLVERPEATKRPDEQALDDELAGILRRLLADLGEPYQDVLELRFFGELSTREIAAQLDCPHGTVRWRLHEGLRRMRSELDERHGGREHWHASLLAFGGHDRLVLAPPAPTPAAPGKLLGLLVPGATAAVCLTLLALACARPDTELTHADTRRGPVAAAPVHQGPGPRTNEASDAGTSPSSTTRPAHSRSLTPFAELSPAEQFEYGRECGEEAIKSYNERDDDPDAVEYLVDGARCFEDAGLVGKAVQVHNVISTRYPDSLHAEDSKLALGRLYQRIVDVETALATPLGQDCSAPLHDEPNAPGSEYLAAADCVYTGGFAGAALAYRERAAEDPSSIDAEANDAEIKRLRAIVDRLRVKAADYPLPN